MAAEHITRVDPGVDAAEHLQGVAGREGKAGVAANAALRRISSSEEMIMSSERTRETRL
jgi:hypothetical protein